MGAEGFGLPGTGLNLEGRAWSPWLPASSLWVKHDLSGWDPTLPTFLFTFSFFLSVALQVLRSLAFNSFTLSVSQPITGYNHVSSQ